MDQILEDYKLYYKARMDKYENNPLYPNSYQSEKALSDAMQSCNELAEFKDKLSDLNIKNAIALIKDQETARLTHYTSLKEDKRAISPRLILNDIDTATDVNKAIEISNNHDQVGLIEISVDGFIDHVWGKLIPALERIDVAKNAEYPSKYETARQKEITEDEQWLREEIQSINKQLKDWKPEESFDIELVWEHRHRKKIPILDEVLSKRLIELKNYL